MAGLGHAYPQVAASRMSRASSPMMLPVWTDVLLICWTLWLLFLEADSVPRRAVYIAGRPEWC